MKDKFKGLVIGLTVGSLITGATAFAASGKMIEVFYCVNDIKINKVSKMPAEDKPFLYNGTTYVPLAFVAKALEQQVKWDGSTKTVHIGETEGKNELYFDRDIKHMNAQSGYDRNHYSYAYNANSAIKDNVGNEYSNYLTLTTAFLSKEDAWQTIEFPLNGKVKSFKSKVGLTDDNKSTKSTLTVTILGDDNVLYTEKIKAGDFPKDIEIDLKNVLKLQVKLQGEAHNSDKIGLFNPVFTK
ncbi:stalk domain-containing protein [Paenibacillus arenosi]|uniref:NPCBM/NEW2 domain-containing protein n=1 Tax=Paenibacillus arenosi TaxID=2774142 RepID=A0ABR9B175_9BACL|nr:NPCBM/NEW2 domain-containing protein [Paenibacillus arenosi]MBD8499205.1 NPCBM/NEW2 domain-containing protein [Paenibacillus arenosi]